MFVDSEANLSSHLGFRMYGLCKIKLPIGQHSLTGVLCYLNTDLYLRLRHHQRLVLLSSTIAAGNFIMWAFVCCVNKSVRPFGVDRFSETVREKGSALRRIFKEKSLIFRFNMVRSGAQYKILEYGLAVSFNATLGDHLSPRKYKNDNTGGASGQKQPRLKQVFFDTG